MNGRKKLIAGALVAGGLMLGAAGLVIGAGLAKAEASTTTTQAPTPAPAIDVQRVICENDHWNHRFPPDCAGY